tara:strand:+ start:5330 stop:6235 length:906 start_codon:yes stop_codon:yes gene_type:complete
MKVLIYGHKGWIGSMFCDILDNNKIEYFKSECRAYNVENVEEELQNIKPSHVMSFIGRTHGITDDGVTYTTIDYLEQTGKIYENVRDNLFSPLVLSSLCIKYNIHFTYLGTGCIFKYDNEHNLGNEQSGFCESDKPNFFGSAYSVVKGFTDELMHLTENNMNTLNLRIRMPITGKLEPRNFITKITNYEYICSIPNSMTVLDELLPIVLDMATKKTTGTFNLTNPGLISHNEVLTMYRDIVDPEFKWKNFTQEQQSKILDADRSNNCLDTTKLSDLYPNIKPIKKAVYDTMIKMSTNIKNN